MKTNGTDSFLLTPVAPAICGLKPMYVKGNGTRKDARTTYFWKKPNDFFCEQVLIRSFLGQVKTAEEWKAEFAQIERDNPSFGTRGGKDSSAEITAGRNFSAMVVEGLLQPV